MDYRLLGRSGLKVSKLCLGTMTFGAETNLATATKIANSARDAGVNFIDTADGYTGGKSETMVGQLLKEDRRDWILATKVGSAQGTPKRKKGLSRKWMMEAIDASLKRLQTDHVDIYYMHHVDWETPLEESITAMGDIIAAGKALYWGFSNHRPWQIGEIVRICDATGTPRPVICQPYYNAMNRMPENDLLPACDYFGIGVVPYSPLARGVLTAKYEPGKKPGKDTRAGRGDTRMMQTEFRKESLVAAQKIKKHAERHGTHADRFRAQLGAQQRAGHGGDRRSAHAGALAGLSRRAGLHLHGAGRGAPRQAGRAGPSVEPGLFRPALSAGRATRPDRREIAFLPTS